MFRLQSLLQKTPGWINQNFTHHFLDPLKRGLIPGVTYEPRVTQRCKSLKEGHTRTWGEKTGDLCPSVGRSEESFQRNFQSFRPEMEAPSSSTKLAKQLWCMTQKEAYCALYHPFVVALATGLLPMESFQNYLAQDIFYLAAFAEAYGLAVENTDDEEAKKGLRGLQLHVQEELDQVHISVMQSWGLEIPKSTTPNSATTAYTKFLLAVAKGDLKSQYVQISEEETACEHLGESEKVLSKRRKLAAFTIGAMTPCMRLYAFLGQEISRKSLNPGNLNPYAKWVETYASDDFESASLQSEEILDKLALPLSGEVDSEALRSLYGRAMELEVEFFAAQPLPGKSILPLFKSAIGANTHFVFVSDFDSTCTVKDSCPVLAELVLSTADQADTQDLDAQWQALGNQYVVEQKELLDRLLPSAQQEPAEYNAGGLRQVLEELSVFEREANSKVVKSGFLAGLGMDAIKQAGGTVHLHEGCRHLLERMSKENRTLHEMEFHILSVCWSQSFIEGSLSSNGLEFANIHANELQFNHRGVSDGIIVRRIESAVDKDNVLAEILSQAKQKSGQHQDPVSVFIGDSVTDLLCLLRVDVGIVIGGSSSLLRMASAFGIKIVPLYSGVLQQVHKWADSEGEKMYKSPWEKSNGILYRISCWSELNAFLLGS